MKKIRINIDWDLYDEDKGRELTMEEAGVEDHADIEMPEGADVDEYVDEYVNGLDWCVKGYTWEAL